MAIYYKGIVKPIFKHEVIYIGNYGFGFGDRIKFVGKELLFRWIFGQWFESRNYLFHKSWIHRLEKL